MQSNKPQISQSFVHSKIFSLATCTIAVAYFVDVFVGMLMIYVEYENDGAGAFQSEEDKY